MAQQPLAQQPLLYLQVGTQVDYVRGGGGGYRVLHDGAGWKKNRGASGSIRTELPFDVP
jgi:hypothetical protein